MTAAETETKIARKTRTDDSRQLAYELARVLEEKLADDICVLDMRKLMFLTDYFVLATARNPRHAQALANELLRVRQERKIRSLSLEGLPEGSWVLFDAGDVVVHIFNVDTRSFYDLEHLWADAPRCRWKLKSASRISAKTRPE